MKQINFELALLWQMTSKALNVFTPSEELSPAGAPVSSISALLMLRVSLNLLEAKGIGGDSNGDGGQHLGGAQK